MHRIMEKRNYPKFLYDGLHPNKKGYDFMFKVIKRFIEKNNLI